MSPRGFAGEHSLTSGHLDFRLGTSRILGEQISVVLNWPVYTHCYDHRKSLGSQHAFSDPQFPCINGKVVVSKGTFEGMDMSRSGTASQELSPLTLVMSLSALASDILFSILTFWDDSPGLVPSSICRNPVPPSNGASSQAIQEVLRDCSFLIARGWEGLDLRVIRIQSQPCWTLRESEEQLSSYLESWGSTQPRAVLLTKPVQLQPVVSTCSCK